MKTVIVGGVAGGASAATRLRRNDEKTEIIMIDKGEYVSFANCGLPYYIGNVIKLKEDLILQTPKSFKKRFNIDVRLRSEVISVDTENNSIIIKDLNNNTTYVESYDNLLLSPGAKPLKPANIDGIENSNVFVLRNIKDMDLIKNYIDYKKPKNCTVIGGGYIGLEVADNISKLGLDVTIVEASSHVINTLDLDMAHFVHNHIRDNNVKLLLGKTATKINSNYIELQNSDKVFSDMVILSIGVIPDTFFLKNSGILLGDRGHIIVDEYLRTNISNIYAVGDSVSITNYIDKSKAAIPLAGPANKQGRIAADNICGKNIKYNGTQGTAIAKVFDITVAVTGLSEEYLKKNNIEYLKSITYSYSNATYYPGAKPMRIKLIFNKSGDILGTQIVGYDGVDKRIDVIATAIRGKMSVYDLQELELAYAPPFSSAKDPVNMAGYVAANILNGYTNPFYIEDVENIEDDSIILDVRTDEEFRRGNLDNSIKISIDELRENLNNIDKSKKIYLYCRIGQRGYIAERILRQNGFENVYNLSGGYLMYEDMIKDIEI